MFQVRIRVSELQESTRPSTFHPADDLPLESEALVTRSGCRHKTEVSPGKETVGQRNYINYCQLDLKLTPSSILPVRYDYCSVILQTTLKESLLSNARSPHFYLLTRYCVTDPSLSDPAHEIPLYR